MKKEEDKIRLKVAKEELAYWEHRIKYYKLAVRNGRCDECRNPLTSDEKDVCENCLCPE